MRRICLTTNKIFKLRGLNFFQRYKLHHNAVLENCRINFAVPECYALINSKQSECYVTTSYGRYQQPASVTMIFKSLYQDLGKKAKSLPRSHRFFIHLFSVLCLVFVHLYGNSVDESFNQYLCAALSQGHPLLPWWRHQMETFSALLNICARNSPVAGEFLAQRPVTRSFDVFFDLGLNERLGKQSWDWWFKTPSRTLWRHSDAMD